MVIFARMGYPGKKNSNRDLLLGCPSENTGLYGTVFLLGQGCPGKNNWIFLVSAIAALLPGHPVPVKKTI